MVEKATLDNGLGFVRGDVCSIYRVISDLPSGTAVSIAWLMVKTAYSVADGSATISKEVTTTNVAGTGQIEDDGTTDGTATLRFDLTNTNTTAVTADVLYVYGIQYKLSDGTVREFEHGTVTWAAEVVQDTT